MFSVSMIVISIILFENSYKKENKSLAIFGIEVLILAITNLALMYLYIMKKEIFMICYFEFYYGGYFVLYNKIYSDIYKIEKAILQRK